MVLMHLMSAGVVVELQTVLVDVKPLWLLLCLTAPVKPTLSTLLVATVQSEWT